MSTLINTTNFKSLQQQEVVTDNLRVQKHKQEKELALFPNEKVSEITNFENQEEKNQKNKNKWIAVGAGVVVTVGLLTLAYFKRDSIKNFLKQTKV